MVILLICIVVFGIVTDGLSIWMKTRVNEELPEGSRLSWWSRDYRQINQSYGKLHPDSILPDLNGWCGYLVLALVGVLIVVGFIQRN